MTGIVYDENFTAHRCLWDENYSENPLRYTSIIDRCNSLGLIDRCVKIKTRLATREEVLLKHTAEHIDLLQNSENYNDEKLEQVSSKFDSVYINPFTYKQSLLAAGSSIELVKAVVDGHVQNGMAFIRPPGHHAMKSEYCGYCFFNNVAIATQYLLDSMGLKKILIVDWDIHHGQATQQMFYDDPRVLYFSIHRYEHGQFWPNLRESDFDYVGGGDGAGFNVNVPLNNIGMKNEDYMAIIHYVLIPLAIEFSPELIIVSSGYDSAFGDPKGEMLVTPACYAHITQKLMSLVNGKVVCILEGGYYLKSLAESAALTLRTLLRDPCPVVTSLKQPCESVMESIRNVIHAHENYWDCFKYSILNHANSQEICYDFFEEKPTIYQTRNMYPKMDTTNLDVILNNIINETTLLNPPVKMGLTFRAVNNSNKNAVNDEIFQHLKSQIEHLHVLKERQSTIEEINLIYTTQEIRKLLNQLKCYNNEQSCNDINYDTIEKNFELNKFSLYFGSLIQIVDAIFNNKIKSGISVSLSTINCNNDEDTFNLNGPIVSAKYAIKQYLLKRVLIIEWNKNDLQNHCDDQIMIISVYRLLSSLFTSNKSNIDATHINIPWQKEKLNDIEFSTVMLHLILPIAYEYNPELIIVSTEFCTKTNETSGIHVSPIIYGHLILWLNTLANGRLILCEQDTNDTSTYRKECLLECSKALLGKPIPKLCVKNKNISNLDTKQHLEYSVKKYTNVWKCLQY